MNCEEMVQVGDEFKRQHYIKYPICDTNCGDKCEFKKKTKKNQSKKSKINFSNVCKSALLILRFAVTKTP